MKAFFVSPISRFASLLWMTVLCAGCGPVAPQATEVTVGPHLLISYPATEVVEPEQKQEGISVEPSETFYLEYALGSGDDGYDILMINGDGTGKYTYWDNSGERLRQAKEELSLTTDQLKAICDQVNQSKFLALADEYVAKVPGGGKQIALTVVSGEVEKEVFCDNHFPVEVVSLASFLEEKIIPREQ